METLLVIAFHFPPYPGVGSRRWTKMVKALAKKGYDIHVIAVMNPFKEESLWTSDIDRPNIKVHYLRNPYPREVLIGPKNWLEKVKYRMHIKMLKKVYKGTIYDKAIFLEQPVKKLANKLIQAHNINNVLANGAPFSMLYYTAQLKEQHPNLNVVCDLRDPWTDGIVYGYADLEPERMAYEKMMERYVAEHADYVTTPVAPMTSRLACDYQDQPASKFITLPHAYDEDNYRIIRAEPTGKLQLVFGGTIELVDIDTLFDPLLEALQQLKQEQPDAYALLDLVFYTNAPRLQQKVAEAQVEAIRFEAPVPVNDYFRAMSSGNVLMIFLPDHVKDYHITKFAEYIPMQKPLAVFSQEGLLGTYVEEHHIGYALNPNTYIAKLLEMLEAFQQKTLVFDSEYNYQAYASDAVADRLVELLKK